MALKNTTCPSLPATALIVVAQDGTFVLVNFRDVKLTRSKRKR